MLLRHYKNGSASARAVAEASLEWKSCETCTIEELNEAVWSEEVYRMTVDESEERIRVIWESEARANEWLSCRSVSYDAVWQLLQEAQLQGQSTKRQSKLTEPKGFRVTPDSDVDCGDVLSWRHDWNYFPDS